MRKFLLLPVGALLNAITILLLTWCDIPLSLTSILLGNGLIWTIFIISFKPYFKTKSNIFTLHLTPQTNIGLLETVCIALLCAIALYAITHTILPTFHYDSLVNWNMRSKLAYYRAEMIFENNGSLILKPYYPMLFHAIQVSAMQFASGWSDMVANGVHLVLAASLLGLVYVLLREHMSRQSSIVTFSLLLGLPLFSMHTGQSYADLPLIAYALVSLLFFHRFIRTVQRGNALLSGLMVSACVWTKAEGLIFCLLPWLTMCGIYLAHHREMIPSLRYPIGVAVSISALWVVFLWSHGYPLTPHGATDSQLQFTWIAVLSLLEAMFVSGSFGVVWYALIIGSWICIRERLYSPTLTWGLLSLLGYIGVYLFTSNAEYLILGQSFDRQMLLPTTLLIASISLLFSEHSTVLTR